MRLSLVTCFLIGIILMAVRLNCPSPDNWDKLHVTGWDAFGYYMYAPSIIIYDDATQLEWLDEMDAKYNLTGGALYQADMRENGNYVFKYSGGISWMQLPFFLTAHAYASASDYPADGFSPPYQWGAALSGLIYGILAFFILRVVLLRWYSEWVTSLTLLLVALATNLMQYVAIDSTMSHTYILFLYSFVLYATIRWHEKPKWIWAALVGYTIGVATIGRPTEAIMLFIPLFWGMQNKAASREKWAMVKKHSFHVGVILFCGLLGILPMLIYWKFAYGSFIYPMGSKWSFLLPYFEVLFGGSKGWFIYTPITVLFIAGLFYIKKFPFRIAVLVFTISNIWIVIAWSDPNYGASYSARALVQGYPVMALAMAAVLKVILEKKWAWAFYVVAGYLTVVNLFQIWQYRREIIHYDSNSFAYYRRVYLDPSPSPLDMSLLDTDEILSNPEDFDKTPLVSSTSSGDLIQTPGQPLLLYNGGLDYAGEERWLHVKAQVYGGEGFHCGHFKCDLSVPDSVKTVQIDLRNAMTGQHLDNDYEFFVEVPEEFQKPKVNLVLESCADLVGEMKSCEVSFLGRND